MNEMIGKAVAKASTDELFQALSYGALKVRAARIASNHIIRIGKFDLMVAEDENGDGQVVQAILPMEEMQVMALANARELDSSAEGWSESDRRQWLADFWDGLAQYLAKWQGIRMRRGPGENMTFEKAVSR
ncbi:MAG: hypothetical protein A4E49_03018 [Methanosaeta sp. PtaU1.Bin112]|nr:MAG: hypothetical protein A4E49_03018 [Methanosaeta sp. PtaU1.Bin112]